MSDNAELDALEAELVHGRAMGDLADVRAQRITSLTEQLAAAQAVIAEAHRATAPLPGETSYVDAYYRVASILSQSPTDALQAVKEAAWDEGYIYAYPVGFSEAMGGEIEHQAPNPYRKDKTDE